MVYVGMTAVPQGIGCQILSGLDTYILDMKEIDIILSEIKIGTKENVNTTVDWNARSVARYHTLGSISAKS